MHSQSQRANMVHLEQMFKSLCMSYTLIRQPGSTAKGLWEVLKLLARTLSSLLEALEISHS